MEETLEEAMSEMLVGEHTDGSGEAHDTLSGPVVRTLAVGSGVEGKDIALAAFGTLVDAHGVDASAVVAGNHLSLVPFVVARVEDESEGGRDVGESDTGESGDDGSKELHGDGSGRSEGG